MKLNTKIKDQGERLCVVDELVRDNLITEAQADYLADYLLFVADASQTSKERQEEYPIITKNRDATVNKRQISFEETVSSLPNGEDGIYAMIVNDKDALLDNKDTITDKDKATIPGIAENLAVIDSLKKQLAAAGGRRKYLLKCQIISKYQEIYTLKASFCPQRSKAMPNLRALTGVTLDENITLDENDQPVSDGLVSLFRKDHVSFLLEYYQELKSETEGNFSSDLYYLLLDLEKLVREALADEPVLNSLFQWKTQGYPGADIVDMMYEEHGVLHTEQYYSILWRSRVPRLVAETAKKRYVLWHYMYEDPKSAHWKICTVCGKAKLASPLFFDRNTSSDGYYSMCKCCRADKHKINKKKKVSRIGQ